MNFRILTLLKALALLLCVGLVAGCSTDQGALPEPTRAINSLPTAAPTPTPAGPHPVTVAAPRSEIKLTILHTNDSRGYVGPCG